MGWSKNKPTKEGTYWVMANTLLSRNKYIHPVKVYDSNQDGIVDTVFSDGENFSIDSDMFVLWFDEEIKEPERSIGIYTNE